MIKSIKAIDLPIPPGSSLYGDSNERALEENRRRLAFGVVGVPVSYVGTPSLAWNFISDEARAEITSAVPMGMGISSVEVYDNGAVNAYYRPREGEHASGFVQYRELFSGEDVAKAMRIIANKLDHAYPYSEDEWLSISPSCYLNVFMSGEQRCATLYLVIDWKCQERCYMPILSPASPVEPQLSPYERYERRRRRVAGENTNVIRRNRLARRYFFRWPGMPNPFDIYATSVKEAKESIKRTFDFKRLPNGFEIWQAP